jgi:hypothetical protein
VPNGLDFTVYSAYPGLLVVVREGKNFHDTVWECNSPVVPNPQGFNVKLRITFVNTNPNYFQGANKFPTQDVDDTSRQLQEHIDSLVDYEPLKNYTHSISIYNDLTILQVHNTCLIRVFQNPQNPIDTSVTLPTNLDSGFTCLVVQMSWKKVNFSVSGIASLNKRYRGYLLTFTAPSTWTATPVDATGGAVAEIAAGNYYINGDGLKLHPAVSLRGAGMGSTNIFAAANLVGGSDPNVPTSGNAALLYICSRTLGPNPTVAQAWQPTVSQITFRGDDTPKVANGISGCVLETGSNDPNFTDPKAYDNGSANFVNVAFYNFGGLGVFSQSNRQRFYAQYLRCVGNNNDGLRILGNDPVIGERCGFGDNNGFGLSAVNISGVLVEGVNCFSSKERKADALAASFKNCNGVSIVNSVFNDTVLLNGGTQLDNVSKGVSISGCDFRPNDVFEDNGTPKWTGPIADKPKYDCFIRVESLKNVVISGSSFCNNGTASGRFAYHVIADLGAAVSYKAEIISDPATTSSSANFRTSPVLATPGSGSLVIVDADDLFTGAKYLGVVRDPVSSTAPVMRGVSLPVLPAPVLPPAGYVAMDGGPLLHTYSRELSDTASQFFVFTGSGTKTVTINNGARYCNVDYTGATGSPALQINLPKSAGQDKELKLVIRGPVNIPIAVTYAFGSDSFVPNELPLPPTVNGRLQLELLRRGNGVWYYLDQSFLAFPVALGGETTPVPINSGLLYRLRAPSALQLTEIFASLETAQIGSALTLDVRNGAGTSLFTTQPVIAANALTTLDAGSTAGTLSPTTLTRLAKNDQLRLFVTATAGTTGAAGLKLWFKGWTV